MKKRELLPPEFDERVIEAVKHFWKTRGTRTGGGQEGGRASVIGGKNLDGFATLIKTVSDYCSVPGDSIIIQGKKDLTIPGFFRPTKMWDALVVYNGRLVAAFELKSQVGSFGNNFNNRTEESIGSAKDFWTAYREKAFTLENYVAKDDVRNIREDLKPPFLGYLMLLEECEDSISRVNVDENHFFTFPEFKNASYAQRYQLLCEKLVTERLYTSASLVLSRSDAGKKNGSYSSPTKHLSPRSLFSDFAAALLSVLNTYR